MRAILIPVKDLSCAKQRLAPMLAQIERTALAAAMQRAEAMAQENGAGQSKVEAPAASSADDEPSDAE